MNNVSVDSLGYINSTTISRFEKGEIINYLDTGSITENKISEIKSLVVGKDKIPSRARRKINKNTIVYSSVRPILKHYGIIRKPVNNMVGSTGFITIDIDETKVDADYLYYCIIQDKYTEYLARIADTNVSSYPSIKPSDLGDMKIEIIEDINVQRKIGTVLRNIDLKIEINNNINIEIEKLTKLIFNYWFLQYEFPNEEGKPYKLSGGKTVWNEGLKREIPEGMDVCTLDNYVLLQTEIFNPKREQHSIVEHYSIPAFDNNRLPVFESSKNIGSNKYKVKPDNILVSKLNPRFPRVWKPFCLSDKAICSTEFMVYEVKNKDFINYCNSLFLSNHFQSYLVAQETGTTGSRRRVEPEASLKYKMIRFPDYVLKKYGELTEPYFKTIMSNLLENEELIKLRDWLVPMLMNGQVTLK